MMRECNDELRLLIENINKGKFRESADLMKEMNPCEVDGDIWAILEATVCQGLNDREGMYAAICRGLTANGRNYELYLLLGAYYEGRNLKQAYLCYENALFHCTSDEDAQIICSLMENLRQKCECVLPKVAIVILSCNLLDVTRACVESVRKTVPEQAREIVVVDNASTDGSVDWLKKQPDIKVQCNEKNVGFPIGCNQGIALAGQDADIFLLNNDTVLPDNALFWLRMGLYEDERIGSTGSLSNYVTNFQQVVIPDNTYDGYMEYADKVNIPMENPYEEKLYLVGFALLLKRTVLEEVGLLDEVFSPGNYEDADMGLRILLAGYKNILCRNSFIFHWGSMSFKKDVEEYDNLLQKNRRIFAAKWQGLRLDYFALVRNDIISMMREYRLSEDMKILEVGCGCGTTLARLKSIGQGIEVYGMEIDPMAAEIAGHFADVVCVNVENVSGDDMAGCFDCIILADVLEHLQNPWRTLREICKMLKRGGYIVASLPNVMHYSIMFPLCNCSEPPYPKMNSG